MAIVTTGQITIIDQNDARSITAVLGADKTTQSIYTADESMFTYVPANTAGSPITLTPSISIGGLTTAEAWARCTNKQFSFTNKGTPLTSASAPGNFKDGTTNLVVTNPFVINTYADGSSSIPTMAIGGCLSDTTGSVTIYFTCTYTDLATGLANDISCSISLSTLKTGTNAVFITLRGSNAIEKSDTATKAGTSISADLVRAGGLDTTGLTYKWYDIDAAGVPTQISSTTPSGVATKYGLKTVASPNAPVFSNTDLNVGLPVSGSGNASNTLSISETAVAEIKNYKVEITGSDAKTYQFYFTIFDVSDPYDLRIDSTTGDKILNGSGSTTLTPSVSTGGAGGGQVALDSSWTFTWSITDKNGLPAGFTNQAKVATPGFPITANTATGFSFTGTAGGGAASGDLCKVVKPDGTIRYYEINTIGAGTCTIKAGPTAPNAAFTAVNNPAPAVNDFVGGKFFICHLGGIRTTTGAAGIVVTSDDIDNKNRIMCSADFV